MLVAYVRSSKFSILICECTFVYAGSSTHIETVFKMYSYHKIIILQPAGLPDILSHQIGITIYSA